MSKHRLALHLSILLLASPVTASFAQSARVDHLAAGTPCCGQYECIEDWSLTPASGADALLKVLVAWVFRAADWWLTHRGAMTNIRFRSHWEKHHDAPQR